MDLLGGIDTGALGRLVEALGYGNEARSFNEAATLGASPQSQLAALMGLMKRDEQQRQLESQDYIANRRALTDQNVAQIGANLGYAKLPVEQNIASMKLQGELAQQAAAAQNAMALQNSRQAFEASTVPASTSAQLQSHEKVAQTKVEAEAAQHAIANQLKLMGYQQQGQFHNDKMGLEQGKMQQKATSDNANIMIKMLDATKGIPDEVKPLIMGALGGPNHANGEARMQMFLQAANSVGWQKALEALRAGK